jgi:hypothetical protein
VFEGRCADQDDGLRKHRSYTLGAAMCCGDTQTETREQEGAYRMPKYCRIDYINSSVGDDAKAAIRCSITPFHHTENK